MQTQISVFQFQVAQSVRVEIKNGEPWFCLKDVAEILEIRDTKSTNFRLKESGIEKIRLQTGGGKQQLTFINEPNLYRVIFRSNKPEAVKFQDWIFEEVIPAIRQTGRYELHLDRWLTEWEREQIRKAVKERCGRTGETSQAVYAKLHRFMDVPSYEQIGATQFQTALNFLASIQDAPEVFRQPQAARFDDMEIARLATVVYYCNWACRLLEEVNEPLRALGYGKAVTMWTVANESGSFLKASREVLERELPNISDGYCRDHIQGSLRRFDAVQAV
ncbi:Bro-N domain-containing protein [Neisseria dentiae]|uniref:BRO-N domain-containing protein n=1 Tax=Neisseria dentiae TaxID=194197 RepID=UPI0035A11C05